jgi:hypothetical protein
MTTKNAIYTVKFKEVENKKPIGSWYIQDSVKTLKQAESIKNKTIKNAQKYKANIKCVIKKEIPRYTKDGYQKGLSAGDKRIIDG